jgi:four helix bundle protein
MGDFRKLEVWQRARELTNLAYRATREFPVDERFGLTSQIRRAGVSVMANIAEGCGRNRPGELIHFLSIASGSATELQSHFIVAEDQGFLNEPVASELQNRVERIRRMLWGLIRHLRDH